MKRLIDRDKNTDGIDTLDRISNEIDQRLYNFDHLLEEKIKEAKQQAVNEFAEKLKEELEHIVMCAVNESWGAAYEYVNLLVKEVCGE